MGFGTIGITNNIDSKDGPADDEIYYVLRIGWWLNGVSKVYSSLNDKAAMIEDKCEDEQFCPGENSYDLKISVNTKEKVIRFGCDKKELSIKNIDIDQQYHLFVSIYTESYSFRIVQFESHAISD